METAKFVFLRIHDYGLDILHQALTRRHVIISELSLCYSGLTKSSSSAISDITISCKIKVLNISANKFIGENERLYSIISDPSSALEELYIKNAMLSSSGAIKLFTALSKNKKLSIECNDVTDRACDAIVMAIKKNTSLTEMSIDRNPISGKCLQLIVQALHDNSSLQQLWLSCNKYSEDIREKIKLSAGEITRKEKISEYESIFDEYVLGIYLLDESS